MRADLHHADLYNADLRRADLMDANLSEASRSLCTRRSEIGVSNAGLITGSGIAGSNGLANGPRNRSRRAGLTIDGRRTDTSARLKLGLIMRQGINQKLKGAFGGS